MSRRPVGRAKVVEIPVNHTISMPDPADGGKSCSPDRRIQLEDEVFAAWMLGDHQQTISRTMRVGYKFIDDVLRDRLTVLRRAA